MAIPRPKTQPNSPATAFVFEPMDLVGENGKYLPSFLKAIFIGKPKAGKSTTAQEVALIASGVDYTRMTYEEVLAVNAAKLSPVVVLSTLNERAEIGAPVFPLRVVPWLSNYSPNVIIEFIKRYEDDPSVRTLIIDSWTHFWNGPGGAQDIVQTLGGSFGAWAEYGNKMEYRMLRTLAEAKINVLLTIRAKDKIKVTPGADGKTVESIKSIGDAPVQRATAPFETDHLFVHNRDDLQALYRGRLLLPGGESLHNTKIKLNPKSVNAFAQRLIDWHHQEVPDITAELIARSREVLGERS